MNRHEWTVAILRIFAILWIAKTVALIPGTLSFAVGEIEDSRSASVLKTAGMVAGSLTFLVLIAMAILIWVYSGKIASYIWRGEPEAGVESPVTSGELQVALIAMLGLYILVSALPGAASTAVYLHHRVARLSANYGYPDGFASRTIGLALQVAAGLWLFLRPRFFAGLISWRHKPREEQSDT